MRHVCNDGVMFWRRSCVDVTTNRYRFLPLRRNNSFGRSDHTAFLTCKASTVVISVACPSTRSPTWNLVRPFVWVHQNILVPSGERVCPQLVCWGANKSLRGMRTHGLSAHAGPPVPHTTLLHSTTNLTTVAKRHCLKIASPLDHLLPSDRCIDSPQHTQQDLHIQ